MSYITTSQTIGPFPHEAWAWAVELTARVDSSAAQIKVRGAIFDGDGQHINDAWAEAWLDDAWYSFDVTNELARPERHLKLAVGLDYLDACPVRGMRRGSGLGEQMHARVVVAPLLRSQQ